MTNTEVNDLLWGESVPKMTTENTKKPRTIHILNLWRSRMEYHCEHQKENKIAKLHDNDPLHKSLCSLATNMADEVVKFVPELKTKIEERKDDIIGKVINQLPCEIMRFSSETTQETQKLIAECVRQTDIIYENYIEIKAMTSACDTYEQEMAVLKNYGVVDADGKLNVPAV